MRRVRIAEKENRGVNITAPLMPVQAQWFPLALPYRSFQGERIGRGVTVGVSSRLVEIQEELTCGDRVRLEIDWPARLDNGCALRLVVYGRVLPDGMVTIGRHEFRVRAH